MRENFGSGHDHDITHNYERGASAAVERPVVFPVWMGKDAQAHEIETATIEDTLLSGLPDEERVVKNVKLSEHEEIRIEHKIYHGHEGIDVRVWVILKGQSDFTPTHQAFWLSMERADIFFKAFEDEYRAEPAPDETGDDGKEGTGSSTGAREPMDQPYPSDPQPSDRQDM